MRRWTQTFTGLMPPFKSWMPPKVIAQAAAWGDSVLGREAPASKEELSTLKYSFPDALPKVMLLAAHWQHAASMWSLLLAGSLHGPIWSASPKLSLSLCQQCLDISVLRNQRYVMFAGRIAVFDTVGGTI